jgi:four helix bundle protein
MSFMKFEKMSIYKKSIKLLSEVYSITKKLPSSEAFNMSSQIQRAALSISSNIAEGSGRGSDKDFARFITISKGSLYEVYSIGTAIQEIYPELSLDISKLKELLVEIEQEIIVFYKYLVK